jgi:hypothetical protein
MKQFTSKKSALNLAPKTIVNVTSYHYDYPQDHRYREFLGKRQSEMVVLRVQSGVVEFAGIQTMSSPPRIGTRNPSFFFNKVTGAIEYRVEATCTRFDGRIGCIDLVLHEFRIADIQSALPDSFDKAWFA